MFFLTHQTLFQKTFAVFYFHALDNPPCTAVQQSFSTTHTIRPKLAESIMDVKNLRDKVKNIARFFVLTLYEES